MVEKGEVEFDPATIMGGRTDGVVFISASMKVYVVENAEHGKQIVFQPQ